MSRSTETTRELRSGMLFCFSVIIVFVLVGSYIRGGGQDSRDIRGDVTSQTSQAEQPIEQSLSPQSSQPTPGQPRLQARDVVEAVRRVYGSVVNVDTTRTSLGDFNGDGAEDLAVAVKPGPGMVAQINDELAMWELEDPHLIVAPSLNKRAPVPAQKQVAVYAGQTDTLLVVIHGNGPLGWHDPKANGTYLLKNAVGSSMSTQTLRAALGAMRGAEDAPSLRGDIIKEKLMGKSGFIFWTGALYSWHED